MSNSLTALVTMFVMMGCSGTDNSLNPIETATKIEKGRAAVLETGAPCEELEKAWDAHSRKALANAPFKKMFNFMDENVSKIVGTDNNETYEEQFCDFQIAHNDVDQAYLAADRRGCKNIYPWLETGYVLKSFMQEVNYFRDRFSGWMPKYAIGGMRAPYWSKECEAKAHAHLKEKQK